MQEKEELVGGKNWGRSQGFRENGKAGDIIVFSWQSSQGTICQRGFVVIMVGALLNQSGAFWFVRSGSNQIAVFLNNF